MDVQAACWLIPKMDLQQHWGRAGEGLNLVGRYARVGCLIVIAVVDTLGVLLASNLVAVLRGKVAIVRGAVSVFFGGDLCLVGFSMRRTLRGDLSISHAVRDAGLLMALPGVYRMPLVIGGLLCHRARNRNRNECCRKHCC